MTSETFKKFFIAIAAVGVLLLLFLLGRTLWTTIRFQDTLINSTLKAQELKDEWEVQTLRKALGQGTAPAAAPRAEPAPVPIPKPVETPAAEPTPKPPCLDPAPAPAPSGPCASLKGLDRCRCEALVLKQDRQCDS